MSQLALALPAPKPVHVTFHNARTGLSWSWKLVCSVAGARAKAEQTKASLVLLGEPVTFEVRT